MRIECARVRIECVCVCVAGDVQATLRLLKLFAGRRVPLPAGGGWAPVTVLDAMRWCGLAVRPYLTTFDQYLTSRVGPAGCGPPYLTGRV